MLLKGIHFDKSSASPVYIQISQQIINAIQRSYLAGGSYPEPESLAINKCPPKHSRCI
jgi:DNA-binding transcriptional regulator YhcF (GntR family)